MAEQSLKDKTVKGVAWSGIDNVAQMGVTFVVSIILARLLSPDDYGLLGIIAIFTSISGVIINGGFQNALIRKVNPSEDDYSTAFLINFCLSLFLYLVIFICSPVIADYFERDELIILTRVSSLSIIVNALALVQQTRLTKRIDFKTQTKITITASVTSGLVGICMAFLGCGVWSIVAQNLTSQSVRALLLWIKNKWIPKFRFSVKSFKELFGFGWKLTASGLLDTVWRELYQVIVGKYYSPATLGQYTRSKQFSQMLSNNLTTIIQRVTFPVLSNIQDDKERMITAYRRIIKMTMFITVTSMFALGAVAEPLLFCLIGPQWHDAAVYLPFICLIGCLYPLHAINLNMLQIQGRSDLFLGLEVIKKTIALGPLFVGAFVGVIPMLCTSILTGIIAFFLNSYFPGKLLGYSSWMQIKDIAPSFGIAAIVAVSIYFFKYLPISFWLILPIQIVCGLAVFYIVCKITKNEDYIEVISLIKSLVKRILSTNG